jgi:hypothetical protein
LPETGTALLCLDKIPKAVDKFRRLLRGGWRYFYDLNPLVKNKIIFREISLLAAM